MADASVEVELRQIVRWFPPPTDARPLDGVSLRLEPGEHVAITGPSGSGKSTLLNILGLLDQPSQGRYLLDGRDVAACSPDELARLRATTMGFIFQRFHLVQHRTALANVELALLYQGVDGKERARLAAAALEEVGLGDRLDATPRTLSGGEQQRVAIARALVGRARLILCDEPTGNLDRTATERILSLFDRIRGMHRTVVVVTHDPLVAARADRCLHLEGGLAVERCA